MRVDWSQCGCFWLWAFLKLVCCWCDAPVGPPWGQQVKQDIGVRIVPEDVLSGFWGGVEVCWRRDEKEGEGTCHTQPRTPPAGGRAHCGNAGTAGRPGTGRSPPRSPGTGLMSGFQSSQVDSACCRSACLSGKDLRERAGAGWGKTCW